MKETYNEYERKLSTLIYEKTKGDIPEDMCLNLARVMNNRRQANVSGVANYTMEECAEIMIKNYYA